MIIVGAKDSMVGTYFGKNSEQFLRLGLKLIKHGAMV